ncbi:MAG: hypothetical protein WBP74_10790, partial [Nitrososphaeraceae archaeon]
MKSTFKLITLGIVLLISMSTGVWTFNLAFAKNKDMQLEISDCPVQRTATTEKSGPCPEMGTAIKLDNSIDNNMIKSQTATDKSSEPTPIHSNLDDSFEQVD